jgi:polyferredoxin
MSTKSAALKRKSARNLRHIVQAAFFVLVAITTTASILSERGISIPILPDASLHAVCPFGGVVAFYQLINVGTLVKKVHQSSVVLAVVGLLLSLLFGPVICGWVCPFGTFQEWLGALGRKIFKKKYNTFVPPALDKVLRYLRYGVLAWVSYMTIVTGKLWFEAYDPYFALFNFWTGEVAITGFIALAVVVLLTLFVERPFCKYACPYGAFQGIFNLFRIFGIRRNAPTCISCKACNKACPMNIDVMGGKVVRDHQCISCLECTSEVACPVPATVEMLALPGSVKDSFSKKSKE